MNSRLVAIFAVVVALLVGTSIWFLYSDYAPHHTPKPEPAAAPAPKKATPDPKLSDSRPTVVTPAPREGTKPVPPKPAPAALTEDDRKIDEALRMFGNTD